MIDTAVCLTESLLQQHITSMKFFATVFTLVVANVIGQDLDCSFRGEINLDLGMKLRQIANQKDNTFTIELEYPGIGWLGFGASPEGMVGSVGRL